MSISFSISTTHYFSSPVFFCLFYIDLVSTSFLSHFFVNSLYILHDFFKPFVCITCMTIYFVCDIYFQMNSFIKLSLFFISDDYSSFKSFIFYFWTPFIHPNPVIFVTFLIKVPLSNNLFFFSNLLYTFQFLFFYNPSFFS